MRTSAGKAKTASSPLIGKSVQIHHATDTDKARIEERLRENGGIAGDLSSYQLAAAFEDDEILAAEEFAGPSTARGPDACSLLNCAETPGSARLS